MKNRTFMVGLGVGLILGALLLQIMLIGQGNESSQLLTKPQVQQAAERLGMKVYDGNEQVLTAEEWEAKAKEERQKKEKDEAETKSPAEPAAPSSTKTPAATSPTKTPAAPESTSTPKSPAAPGNTEAAGKPATPKVTPPESSKATGPKKPEQIPFKISSGDNLTKVAEGLKGAGIISDKSAFIQNAVESKANYSLQTGNYIFKPGESLSSIISKITSKPSGK
ncbi:peptidase [Paenibacillus sp. YPG26]|uniref:peptidase n=1 Tax=Paenibacillus sp. YPG26 TaxID=2878915 RepID=UPI00203CF889|nr:peptidase [Paenibacillus sp. YPG26]USB32068.1 peptidase [Paenibacillus sp. YPG26]